MEREPIKIRLTPRVSAHSEAKNQREEFWLSMGQENKNYEELEGQLCQGLGSALHDLLVDHLSAPLDHRNGILLRSEFHELLSLLRKYMETRQSEKVSPREVETESIIRVFEQRQRLIFERPELMAIFGKIAAGTKVIFVFRVTGYSSINLDLSVASLNKLSEAFDNDFESFRVFLEAFVPQAYARVFNYGDDKRLDCLVQIPASYAQAFNVASSPSFPAAIQPQHLVEQSTVGGREKAEWLWRLANGSLILPVLLALYVMYQSVNVIGDATKSQRELMAPIFDHQMKLLEEDRLRLVNRPTPLPPSASTSSAAHPVTR